VSAEPALGSS